MEVLGSIAYLYSVFLAKIFIKTVSEFNKWEWKQSFDDILFIYINPVSVGIIKNHILLENLIR